MKKIEGTFRMTQALAEELSDQFNEFIISQVDEDVQILYFPGRFSAETLRKPEAKPHPSRIDHEPTLFTIREAKEWKVAEHRQA